MSVLSRLAHQWCTRVFGANHAVDLPTRSLRTVEEAIELCQALDVPEGKVRDIIRMVYSRPAGRPYQELGGVLMTAVILCEAMDLNHEVVLESELSRVLSKSVEHFARRNAEKPVAFDEKTMAPRHRAPALWLTSVENEQKTMVPRHPADRSGKDPDTVRHFKSTAIGSVEDMPPYRVNAPGEVGTHVEGERYAYNPDAYYPHTHTLIKPRHHFDAPDAEDLMANHTAGGVGAERLPSEYVKTGNLEDKMRFVNMPSGNYTAGGIGGDGFAGIPHDGGFSADFAPSGQDCIDNDEGA